LYELYEKITTLSALVLVWSQLAFSSSPCEKPMEFFNERGPGRQPNISKTLLEAIELDVNTVHGSARLLAECKSTKNPSDVKCLAASKTTYANGTFLYFVVIPKPGDDNLDSIYTIGADEGFSANDESSNDSINFDGNSVEAYSETSGEYSRFRGVDSNSLLKSTLSYDESSGKLTTEWFTGTRGFLFLKNWKLEEKVVYKCKAL